MKPAIKNPIVQLNIPIREKLKSLAKMAALRQGMSLQDFVTSAILHKIDTDPKRKQ